MAVWLPVRAEPNVLTIRLCPEPHTNKEFRTGWVELAPGEGFGFIRQPPRLHHIQGFNQQRRADPQKYRRIAVHDVVNKRRQRLEIVPSHQIVLFRDWVAGPSGVGDWRVNEERVVSHRAPALPNAGTARSK